MEKIFPKFRYFGPGDREGVPYSGKVTKKAMLKFLDVEDKACDPLTGEFCNKEELAHMKFYAGKTLDELEAEHAAMKKRSAETLKVEERVYVDARLKFLKKHLKALKKAKQ